MEGDADVVQSPRGMSHSLLTVQRFDALCFRLLTFSMRNRVALKGPTSSSKLTRSNHRIPYYSRTFGCSFSSIMSSHGGAGTFG